MMTDSIWEDDTPEEILKKIIFSPILTEVERRIFILHLESKSYKDLAEQLTCSTAKAFLLVKSIKEKIRAEYNSRMNNI